MLIVRPDIVVSFDLVCSGECAGVLSEVLFWSSDEVTLEHVLLCYMYVRGRGMVLFVPSRYSCRGHGKSRDTAR